METSKTFLMFLLIFTKKKKTKDKKSSICFDQCDSFNLLLNFIRKHNLTKKRNQFLLCLNRNYEEENN